MSTETRTYCVGLPVVIEVSDDGTVTYTVDTAEAAQAIREDEFCEHGLADVTRDLDAKAVDADHATRQLRETFPWFSLDVKHYIGSAADTDPQRDQRILSLVRVAGWNIEERTGFSKTYWVVTPPWWGEADERAALEAQSRAILAAGPLGS